MFIDRVRIFVKAGDGGAGALSFRREKHVPRGGPDGGNGGRGGSIVLEVSRDLNTLHDYRFKHHFAARPGGRGGGNRRHGKDGQDLVLQVPPGTLVTEDGQAEPLADLLDPARRLVVAAGGRGGRGNYIFRSATRQVPRIAELGEPGQARWLTLELKLIADVGLLGLPNAGKSTLLAATSAAHPKIADYPFTTLEPLLGVVDLDRDRSFVMADLPGLIEGASEGAGLGLEFLRHVERTRLLIQVVDATSGPADRLLADYELVRDELRRYSPVLGRRPHLVALNKMDAVSDPSQPEAFRRRLLARRRRCYPISAVTGEGVPALLVAAGQALSRKRPAAATPLKVYHGPVEVQPFRIDRVGEAFVVSGARVERLLAMTDLRNPDALISFQRTLDRWGLTDALVRHGAQGGESIRINDVEFLYDPDH